MSRPDLDSIKAGLSYVFLRYDKDENFVRGKGYLVTGVSSIGSLDLISEDALTLFNVNKSEVMPAEVGRVTHCDDPKINRTSSMAYNVQIIGNPRPGILRVVFKPSYETDVKESSVFREGDIINDPENGRVTIVSFVEGTYRFKASVKGSAKELDLVLDKQTHWGKGVSIPKELEADPLKEEKAELENRLEEINEVQRIDSRMAEIESEVEKLLEEAESIMARRSTLVFPKGK